MPIVSVILDPEVIIKILACLDFPTEVPCMRPQAPPGVDGVEAMHLIEVEWK